MKPDTAEELASFLIDRFGFIVMPCKPADWIKTRPYRPRERVHELWGTKTELPVFAMGTCERDDWTAQCAAINERWPGFVPKVSVEAKGYHFWKLVSD
jgi:hypothetical protein